jgi:hypothetical protein
MAYKKLFGLANKGTTPKAITCTASTQVLTTEGSHEIDITVATGIAAVATLPTPSKVPGADIVPGQYVRVTLKSDAVDAADGVETTFTLTPAGLQGIYFTGAEDSVLLMATEESYVLIEDNRRLGVTNCPATVVADNTSTALDISSGMYLVGGVFSVFLTGAMSSNITLPQATIGNKGTIFRVFCLRDMDTDGTCHIGFANGGSTTMNGTINLTSTTANKIDTAPISAAKRLELDANDAAHAGGAEGSVYEFHYLAANTVFCEARALTTNAAPTLDGSEQSTTGIS